MSLNRITEKLFCFFILTILILTLSIQNFYCKERVQSEVPTSLAENPWGMNVHLGFNCTKPHAEEIFKAIKKIGISCVRVDVYWWYDNMFMQKDHCDYAMWLADKYNIDILLVFPQLPNRTDDTFLKEYAGMFEYYCSRYNGKTPIVIKGEQTPRYPKIKYVEPCNEVEYHYRSEKVNVAQTFLLMKTAAQAIHSSDSTIKVVLPGMSSAHSEFLDSLLLSNDSEGHGLFEYFDIFNIHDYSWNTGDFNSNWQYWQNLYHKSKFNDKPIWITEYGKSLWELTKKDQADILLRNSIVQLSKGVQRMFYYHFHSFGGNYFKTHRQIEEYYGIIDTGISNSYVSFMENDGIFNKAISQGDGLEKVYINKNTDSVSIYTMNKIISMKLQENGVAIGGMGYTMDSVVIKSGNKDIVLWRGQKMISSMGKDFLCLDAKLFKNLKDDDKLVVYFSNPKDTNGKWIGLAPYPAYYAYKQLSSVLNEGYTTPTLEIKSRNCFVAKWQNTKKHLYYYALWSEKDNKTINLVSSPKSLRQILSGHSKLYKDRTVILKKTPVFFESDEELVFE